MHIHPLVRNMRGPDRTFSPQPVACDVVSNIHDLIILHSPGHPVQEFPSCIATPGLVGSHDAERLEAVRACAPGSRSSSSVAAILKNRREARAPEQQPSRLHANIRGSQRHH
jgi:hypothetical protein